MKNGLGCSGNVRFLIASSNRSLATQEGQSGSLNCYTTTLEVFIRSTPLVSAINMGDPHINITQISAAAPASVPKNLQWYFGLQQGKPEQKRCWQPTPKHHAMSRGLLLAPHIYWLWSKYTISAGYCRLYSILHSASEKKPLMEEKGALLERPFLLCSQAYLALEKTEPKTAESWRASPGQSLQKWLR